MTKKGMHHSVVPKGYRYIEGHLWTKRGHDTSKSGAHERAEYLRKEGYNVRFS